VVAAEALAEAAFDFAFGFEVALLQNVRAGREAEQMLGIWAFLLAMSLVVGGGLTLMSFGRSVSPRAWRVMSHYWDRCGDTKSKCHYTCAEQRVHPDPPSGSRPPQAAV
jgi:hypothetical protein